MRRIFIDENLSPVLADPLAATYRKRVRFDTWKRLGLSGTDDLELFPLLAELDFAMIITKDGAQLDDDDERAGLADAGLHWLGVPEIEASGTHLIAQQLAVVVPAVGEVLRLWPDQPTAFRLGQPLGTPFAEIQPL